jgi:flagellar biosynthesis/type III secretory pathway protein FliH
MSDEFVPLALYLRPAVSEPATEHAQPAASPPLEIALHPPEHEEALRAVRRFRAALADALDASLQELLRTIASEVLARELRLGGADVAAIVSNALDRFADERIISVHAHPQDCAALAAFPLEHVADNSLVPGDVRIELQSGTIDLTLNARLEAALAAWVA